MGKLVIMQDRALDIITGGVIGSLVTGGASYFRLFAVLADLNRRVSNLENTLRAITRVEIRRSGDNEVS